MIFDRMNGIWKVAMEIPVPPRQSRLPATNVIALFLLVLLALYVIAHPWAFSAEYGGYANDFTHRRGCWLEREGFFNVANCLVAEYATDTIRLVLIVFSIA